MSRGLTHIFNRHIRLGFRKKFGVFVLGKAVFFIDSHEQILHFFAVPVLDPSVSIALIQHIHGKVIALCGGLLQPILRLIRLVIFKQSTGIEILLVRIPVLCFEFQNNFIVAVLAVINIIIIKLTRLGNIRDHLRGRPHHKVPQRFEFLIGFQRNLFGHLVGIVAIVFALKPIPEVI